MIRVSDVCTIHHTAEIDRQTDDLDEKVNALDSKMTAQNDQLNEKLDEIRSLLLRSAESRKERND